MPTLSSTIQMTRSKFAIDVPHSRLSPHYCKITRNPRGRQDSLTISGRLSILLKERLSCYSLNFFAFSCVLQSEEVCDGSKRHAQARFSGFSDSSHCGRRDHPLQQVAAFVRSLADPLDLLAASPNL